MQRISLKLEIVSCDKITKSVTLIDTDSSIQHLLTNYKLQTITTNDFFVIDGKYTVSDILKANDVVKGYTESFISIYGCNYEIGYYTVKTASSHVPNNKRERSMMAKIAKNEYKQNIVEEKEIEMKEIVTNEKSLSDKVIGVEDKYDDVQEKKLKKDYMKIGIEKSNGEDGKKEINDINDNVKIGVENDNIEEGSKDKKEDKPHRKLQNDRIQEKKKEKKKSTSNKADKENKNNSVVEAEEKKNVEDNTRNEKMTKRKKEQKEANTSKFKQFKLKAEKEEEDNIFE